MPPDQIANATVSTRANVYFEGRCVSHSLSLADGTRKSVGVVLPGATLTFNTDVAETMECVAGGCEYRLAGTPDWRSSSAGQRFGIPANTSFELRVTDIYHYVCHFG